MKQIGSFTPDMLLKMKRSLVRTKRTRDANPTISCTTCMDTGRMRFSTGTVACYCEKGQEIEYEQQRRDWLERVERECGVPRKTQADVRRSAFSQEVLQSIRSSLEQSRGTYLHGGVGTGKSTTACAALLESVQGVGDVLVSPRRLGYFTTASDYLQGIRDSYNSGEVGGLGETQRGCERGVANTKLLVLDDVGVERVTDWGAEQITRLVDHRVTAGLPTIFTSNLTLDELERKYNAAAYMMGDRVRSRIEGSCDVLHVDGPDWRRQP